MFYIEIVDTKTNKSKFVRRGEWSKYELTTSWQMALMFDTIDEVKHEIATAEDFNKRIVYTDGSSAPPMLLWSGLNCNHANPVGVGVIRIVEVQHIKRVEIPVTDRHIK